MIDFQKKVDEFVNSEAPRTPEDVNHFLQVFEEIRSASEVLTKEYSQRMKSALNVLQDLRHRTNEKLTENKNACAVEKAEISKSIDDNVRRLTLAEEGHLRSKEKLSFILSEALQTGGGYADWVLEVQRVFQALPASEKTMLMSQVGNWEQGEPYRMMSKVVVEIVDALVQKKAWSELGEEEEELAVEYLVLVLENVVRDYLATP